jgi:hypothetical protein
MSSDFDHDPVLKPLRNATGSVLIDLGVDSISVAGDSILPLAWLCLAGSLAGSLDDLMPDRQTPASLHGPIIAYELAMNVKPKTK